MRILVADKLSELGLGWLGEQDDVTVEVKPGLSPEQLAEAVVGVDGLIIRSGAKVTADVLAAADKLRGIARAGVGVDNVDIPEATARGVLVMNTPDGNTISTAELAISLMMALSRKLAPANASLLSGKWDRKPYQGTQLAGKTLGVVGLGRIGRAVAGRAMGLEMRVIGFDPYLPPNAESDFEIAADLADLCSRADYITVHVPKSDETVGMIGSEQLALMKPSVRLINAARGGIIDEAALADALEAGQVAGAALDVYTAEPPANEVHRRLIEHPAVLAVPHLGASTEEAQDQVAIDAAKELIAALRGDEVRNAINAPGFDGALPPMVRVYVQLAERLGMVLSAVTPGALQKVEVTVRGEIAQQGGEHISPITTHLLVGLLRKRVDRVVNVVNAPVVARNRQIEVDQTVSETTREFTSLLEVTIHTAEETRSGTGTVMDGRYPRITSIDGYRMELSPAGHVAIFVNEDRPGVIGHYGAVLGAAGVNIADMSVSRSSKGRAVVGLNLDEAPSAEVIQQIRDIDFVVEAHALDLPPLPAMA